MTRLIVDTSVLVKWFHSEGESELVEARLLRDAHLTGRLDAHLLDLAVYEVGNVLVRALRWTAADVAAQLADLLAVCGAPLDMAPSWLPRAAELASEHELTFYDAAWAAAAAGLGVTLVSADRRLLTTGLSESPSQVVRRLRLTPG